MGRARASGLAEALLGHADAAEGHVERADDVVDRGAGGDHRVDGLRGRDDHVSPEAAAGGPIALVREGDVIDIDIQAGTLELRVSADELAARRAQWEPPAPKYTTGVLSRYAKLVTSADKGAYLS